MVSQREGEPDWGHHWSYLKSVTRGWRPPKQPDDQRVTHVCRVKLAARRSLLKLSLHWPSRLGSERLESGFQSVFLMMKVTFFFFLLPISGPLPPFLFFCQLHQFSPLSLLPLPLLALLYDQKSKPLKTLSDQCHAVDTDSLLTATAAPSVCTQTDINTCMCVRVSGLHLHSSNEFCLTLGMIGGSISDGGGVVVVCMLRAVNLHTCIYFLTLILSHVDELFHWACSIIGQFTVSTRLAFHSCIYLHCAAYYEKKKASACASALLCSNKW